LAKLVSQTFTRPTRRRFLHRAYLLSVDSIRVECADSFSLSRQFTVIWRWNMRRRTGLSSSVTSSLRHI